MTEPLTYCFHCNDAFQKVERNGAGVPRNVPPFQMERDGQCAIPKSLIQMVKVWNVPYSTDGTGAIRSTPHSPLGSVWKLLGQIKISAVAPLRESHLLERRNASRVPALGCGWENLQGCAPHKTNHSINYDHTSGCCIDALFPCAADIKKFGKSFLFNPNCCVFFCFHFRKQSCFAFTQASECNRFTVIVDMRNNIYVCRSDCNSEHHKFHIIFTLQCFGCKQIGNQKNNSGYQIAHSLLLETSIPLIQCLLNGVYHIDVGAVTASYGHRNHGVFNQSEQVSVSNSIPNGLETNVNPTITPALFVACKRRIYDQCSALPNRGKPRLWFNNVDAQRFQFAFGVVDAFANVCPASASRTINYVNIDITKVADLRSVIPNLCGQNAGQTQSDYQNKVSQEVTQFNRPLRMTLVLQCSCTLLFQPLALSSCFGWKHSSVLAPVQVVLRRQDMTDTHCIQQAVQNRFQEKSETKQTSYINNTNKGTSGKSVAAGSSHLDYSLVRYFY